MTQDASDKVLGGKMKARGWPITTPSISVGEAFWLFAGSPERPRRVQHGQKDLRRFRIHTGSSSLYPTVSRNRLRWISNRCILEGGVLGDLTVSKFGDAGKSCLKQLRLHQRLVDVQYRCEAKSVAGFVQQLACCYLPHGYWFYVTGWVPEHKTPDAVDQKLIEKYRIGISRQSRARRKRVGLANIHYLRFSRYFVLLATHGLHPFFEHEAKAIRDIRRIPIKFGGYSIAYKRGGHKRKAFRGEQPMQDDKWHARVQIGRETYTELAAYFLEMARRRRADELARELYSLPFEPYAPVRQQLLNILRLMNRARKAAHLEPLDPQVLRYRRRIVKPFDADEEEVAV